MAMCSVTVTVISRERDKAAIGPLCRRLCLWSTLPAVCLTAAAGLFSGGIWGLLTPDPELAEAGMAYWSICLCAYPMSHGNDADIGIAGIGQRIPYPRRNGYKGMGGTGTADISFDTPRHVAERAVAGLSHKQRRIPGNMRDICVFTY